MLAFFRVFRAFIVLLCIPSVVFAINLNGSWSYREIGADDSETFREVRQNYSFGAGPALDYSPSHAIKANFSVGYTQNNSLTGQGSQSTRTITPTAGLTLENDLFAFSVSGNSRSSQGGAGDWRSSSSWSTSLISSWDGPFIPRLQFRYSESGQDPEGAPISTLNTQRSTLGAGVDLDLQRADLAYRFTETNNENQSTSQSHFAKFKTGARFWDNRISVRFSQQAQFSNLETIADGVENLDDGRNLRYALSTSEFNADGKPVAATCDGGLIPGEECLADEISPIPYGSDDFIKLAIQPSLSRQVGVVIINYDEADLDFGDSTWDLYVIDDSVNPADWTPIPPGNVTVTDFSGGRLRIDIAEAVRTTREILLVSDQRTFAGQVLRVDVYDVLPGGTRLMARDYNTSTGISVRLTDSLTSSVGLTYVREESETEGAVVDEFNRDKITTSGNISWRPFTFLGTSLGATEYREREMGDEQLINRNYSLVFTSRPTETFNVSLSTQLTERFGGSFPVAQKANERLGYYLSGKAQIYPDLTVSFSLSQEAGKRWVEEDNGGVVTGRFADESIRSGRLNMQVELLEDFTVDFLGRYSLSENDGKEIDSGTAELGLRYRISDLLLLRGSYESDLVNSDRADSFSVTVQASVLSTYRTRLDMQVNHQQAEEATQRIFLNGTWKANNNISMSGRGGYSIAEVNNYFVLFDLRIGI